MLHETLHKKIKEWSNYFDVEPPRLSLKMHVKQMGVLKDCMYINNEQRLLNIDKVRIYGRFNPKNNKITIYKDGNKMGVVKHEFIHYLRKLKLDSIFHWQNLSGISYEEIKEEYPDAFMDEELRTRMLTCCGWITIWDWFNEA